MRGLLVLGIWAVLVGVCAANPAPAACEGVHGQPGICLSDAECASLPAFAPAAPSGVLVRCEESQSGVCCMMRPDVASNPPVPSGWRLMSQADVTANMTEWAVDILRDVPRFALFDVNVGRFPLPPPDHAVLQPVLARVEWHPPDFNNEAVHRGVTLYQCTS